MTYQQADLVTVQTHAALSFFPTNRYKTFVIPNPVVLPRSEPIQSQLYTDDRHLLAIGKLIPQKGFDLAIKAFAQVAQIMNVRSWQASIFITPCTKSTRQIWDRTRDGDLAQIDRTTARNRSH